MLVFVFMVYLVPVWDRFATTVAVGIFGRQGATQDLALRGSWSEWLGRAHKGEFRRNALVHPNGNARPGVS